MPEHDSTWRSDRLPLQTYLRSIFDSQLIRLSDRGGASKRIGDRWSNVVADAVTGWIGGPIPVERASLRESIVTAVHRLDTVPGLSERASRAGLKNPDFVIRLNGPRGPLAMAADAKFSVETASEEQVGPETMAALLADPILAAGLLPEVDGAPFVRGVFVSPNSSLTRAVFRSRVGHRRMSVRVEDVALVDVGASAMFQEDGAADAMTLLAGLDAPPFGIWDSLVCTVYYYRVHRAMAGVALEARLPLFGEAEIVVDDAVVLAELTRRAEQADSAWAVLMEWDRDTDGVRRRRQAMHQVIGSPVTSSELRDRSDVLLKDVEADQRPSRNRVRKAFGARYTADVLARTGVIMPDVGDFSAELERVAGIAREVSERYVAGLDAIVAEILAELVPPSDGGGVTLPGDERTTPVVAQDEK